MDDIRKTGFFKIENSWIDAGIIAKIGPYSWAVLTVLIRHADANGECFPSWDRLQKLTGHSRSRLRDSLKELQETGLISIAKKGRGNLYRISTSSPDELIKNETSSPHELNQFATRTRTSSPHELKPVRHTNSKKTKRKRPNEEDPTKRDGFASLWDGWPKHRKTNKKFALEAWNRAIKQTDPEIILKGVKENGSSLRCFHVFPCRCRLQGRDLSYVVSQQPLHVEVLAGFKCSPVCFYGVDKGK